MIKRFVVGIAAFLALTLIASAQTSETKSPTPAMETAKTEAQSQEPKQEPKQDPKEKAPNPETPAPAEEPPPPEEPPAKPPTPPPPPPAQQEPGVLSEAASASYERREILPSVNVYLPEGEASVRLRKLIRNVLFESQINYEFVNGDISTFLRYKYYARNYTYRLGVFDSINFPDLTSSNSSSGFERVRGGLVLLGVPRNYNSRYFALLEDDRLTFGDTARPDDRKNDIYAKVGYQYGTQFDERMNAIVGEQRGRITPVLTAFREIGPQRMGLAAAITQAARFATGDYSYTKFEAEGLRRFDLTSTSFIFSRLHVGTFIAKDRAVPPPEPGDSNGDGVPDPIPTWELYAIPQFELFRLGGREALRSISTNDNSIGTEEVHLTNELFTPVFRNRDYRVGHLYWNTLYAIGYVGVGSVGFKTSDLTDTHRLVTDVGIGTESAITFQDYDVYLSVIVAHTITGPDALDGGTKVRFSIRTVR